MLFKNTTNFKKHVFVVSILKIFEIWQELLIFRDSHRKE